MALDQNLALEGVALRRVAAGVKQIGIAAEDFAIPEHDHAAAFAYSSILQADMDRIQTVFHDAAGCDVRWSGVDALLCQSGMRSVNARGCPQTDSFRKARSRFANHQCSYGYPPASAATMLAREILGYRCTCRRVLEQEKREQLDRFRRQHAAFMQRRGPGL